MHKHSLYLILAVGFLSAVAFILIQPLFGMATLTSRHAMAYVTLGGYSELAALVVAWFVHIGVSVFYAVVSVIVFKISHLFITNALQIVVLGWVTTLLATPANEFVVKLVTTLQLPTLSSLSAINTEIGPKLWLHVLFFAMIVGGLWFAKVKNILQDR